MPKEVTVANFEEVVLKGDLVLVEFWAVWCGPCRQVGPAINRLASDFAGRAVVGKINVDEQTALAEQYRVMSIPTIYLFKKGEVVEKLVGARSYQDLKAVVEAYLQ